MSSGDTTPSEAALENRLLRYKLDHMVPSGFPIEYWPTGEAKSSLRKTNGRKAGILMSIH